MPRQHCESDDVEEATQDALWSLYRKLGGLQKPAAFLGWPFQIIRRACLRYVRRRVRHESLDAVAGACERDPIASDPELCPIVADVLGKLLPLYREALLLRDVQGLSAEEVADSLAIPLETAKSRVEVICAQG